MKRQPLKAKLDLSNRETKRRLLAFVGAATGKWRVDLAPASDRESLSTRQRGYFHACVGLMAEHASDPGFGDGVHVWTKDEMKDWVVRRVYGTREYADPLTGETYQRRISTEELDKLGYSRLIEGMLALADSMTCELPDCSAWYDPAEVEKGEVANV